MQILNHTIDVIEKAKLKGFNQYDRISPVMSEPWMNAEEAFCNTSCAIISMWLREKGLYVAVAPGFGGFSFFVDGSANSSGNKPHSFGSLTNWETAWLAGIDEALNLLPDETK